jgi:hypothetical protein
MQVGSSAKPRACQRGKLSEATLHAETGEIVAGEARSRAGGDKPLLAPGLSLSDIALGAAMLAKAAWGSGSACYGEDRQRARLAPVNVHNHAWRSCSSGL